VRSGRVERVGRGLYRLAQADPTEDYSLALVAARVPKSVVCLLSALRVHGIGTQTPPAVWIGVPQQARMPSVPEVRLRVVRFSTVAWRFGVKDIRFEGVPARITSPARTIVDCFRFQRLIGPEIPREALEDALRRRIVTIADLSRMEGELPSRTLRAALDQRSL
jgi:predicted transcriptional regulator of viral defense system